MPAVRLLHRSNLALATAVTTALALTACSGSGSGGDPGSGGTGRPAASGSGPVAATLAKYDKPGDPVTVDFPAVKGAAAKLKGKSIYYIPILTNAPLFQSQANLLKAAASKVGNQSRPETIWFETSPGLILPGQRTIAGTRKAPSQFVSFSLRNGVVAASGHDHWFGPLSVV